MCFLIQRGRVFKTEKSPDSSKGRGLPPLREKRKRFFILSLNLQTALRAADSSKSFRFISDLF